MLSKEDALVEFRYSARSLVCAATNTVMRLSTIAAILLCWLLIVTPLHAEQEPLEVLQQHVAEGIAVLEDTTEASTNSATQQQRLCAVAHNMFDIYAFSRLVVAAHWKNFSAPERTEFVDVVGDFLCRY